MTFMMICILLGIGLGFYLIWYIFTGAGTHPIIETPKYWREQERLQRQKEERDRADLAKKIAEEMKKK